MLDSSSLTPKIARSSRKEPLSDDDARGLIAGVKEVRIAKGRKVLVQSADETTIDHLKGPTGNYRAPMIQAGKTLLVGFNQEALEELVGA